MTTKDLKTAIAILMKTSDFKVGNVDFRTYVSKDLKAATLFIFNKRDNTTSGIDNFYATGLISSFDYIFSCFLTVNEDSNKIELKVY